MRSPDIRSPLEMVAETFACTRSIRQILRRYRWRTPLMEDSEDDDLHAFLDDFEQDRDMEAKVSACWK